MARRINTLRRTLTAQIVFRFVCRNKRWCCKRSFPRSQLTAMPTVKGIQRFLKWGQNGAVKWGCGVNTVLWNAVSRVFPHYLPTLWWGQSKNVWIFAIFFENCTKKRWIYSRTCGMLWLQKIKTKEQNNAKQTQTARWRNNTQTRGRTMGRKNHHRA